MGGRHEDGQFPGGRESQDIIRHVAFCIQLCQVLIKEAINQGGTDIAEDQTLGEALLKKDTSPSQAFWNRDFSQFPLRKNVVFDWLLHSMTNSRHCLAFNYVIVTGTPFPD